MSVCEKCPMVVAGISQGKSISAETITKIKETCKKYKLNQITIKDLLIEFNKVIKTLEVK